MNLNNHFKELQKQLKAGHPYWLHQYPKHLITNQPFSGINAFLLGTNPANQKSYFWIDDLNLKKLNLNTDEQAQICLNFSQKNNTSTVINTFPLYNAANLNYENKSEIATLSPYEILNTFQIPYLSNSNEYNITYDPLKKSLCIPEYVKDLNPNLFFKALAQWLYYQDNPSLVNNDSQLIISLTASKLIALFNYKITLLQPNQYLNQYLLNKDLLNPIEQYNFFKILRCVDLLCDNLLNINNTYLEKTLVLNDLDPILPLKTKQELYRGLQTSGFEQKKYLQIIELIKETYQKMNNNQDTKMFFFKYVQSASNGEQIIFYLKQIKNDLYHGILMINNTPQDESTILQKIELDDFELDLNYFNYQ